MVDPTADPGALDDAELGVVDALRELKHEVDLLRGRLAALEGMRANLSDAVYRRVHEDYARRLADLDTHIAPLRAQARLAYAGLRDRIEAIQHAYASIQLDRQEVELRHQLGEYDAATHAERLGTIDAALRERSIAQDRAEALRARFLDVFESEADLEAAPPPVAAAPVPEVPRDAPARAALSLIEEPALDDELAALALDASMLAQIPEPVAASAPAEPAPVPRADTAPAHIDVAVTQILQVLDMPDLPTIPPAPPAATPASAAHAAPAAPSRPVEARPGPAAAVTSIGIATPTPPPVPTGAGGPPAAAVTSGSTMFLRTARLVPQNVEAGRAAIPLPPKPVTLGGDAASDIRVGGPGVEAQHARIEANNQGYVLTDLDSKHGTRVNAEPIRERLLRHEDVIQIGAARYVFREG